MSREQAQRTARLKCDRPEQIKQQVRQAQMGATTEATRKDVRYAIRMLRKNYLKGLSWRLLQLVRRIICIPVSSFMLCLFEVRTES